MNAHQGNGQYARQAHLRCAGQNYYHETWISFLHGERWFLLGGESSRRGVTTVPRLSKMCSGTEVRSMSLRAFSGSAP